MLYHLIIQPPAGKEARDSKDGFVIEPLSGLLKTAIMYRNKRRHHFKFKVVATDDYGRGHSTTAEIVVGLHSVCLPLDSTWLSFFFLILFLYAL